MTHESATMRDPDSDAVELPGNAWTRFWFTPIPTTGLHCLRVLSGLLFCAWLLSFLGHQAEFFSLNGWMDAEAYREVQELQRQPETPPAPIGPVGWSMLYLAGGSAAAFQAMYWGSILVLILFTLGVATRITGVLTWIVVLSFLANPAISYEGDYMLGILAFYLMIGHLLVGHWHGNLTIAEHLLGSRRDFLFSGRLFPSAGAAPLSSGANLVLRMLQIHFTIIILTSVLHKLQMSDWWSGVALWYPLHPTFKTTLETLQREMPSRESTLFMLSVVQYMALAWQLTFPMFAWRSGWWRLLLLGGAVIGWIGTFFVFKLPLLGPFVLLCCLSFLRPEEWAWAAARVQTLWANQAAGRGDAESAKAPVAAGKETNIRK